MQAIVKCYRILLLTGIFLLPFVYWPKAYIAYEIPKVWFFYVWVELLSVLSVLRLMAGAKANKLNKIMYFALGYIAILVLVSIFGVDVRKSVYGNYYRLDGLLTYIHLFALSLSLGLFITKKVLIESFATILTSSVILSLWAVFLYLTTSRYPVGLTFGQPVFLGGFLASTSPLYLYFLHKTRVKRHKILLLIGLAFLVWAIWLSGATGGLIATVVGLVAWNMFKVKKWKLFLLVVALSLTFVAIMASYLKQTPGKNFLFEGRQRIIIKTFLGVFEDRRMFNGFGVANVDYAFNAGVWPVRIYNDVYLDKAHSSILESFATGGVTGLTAYLVLLFVLARQFWSRGGKTSIYKTLFVTLLVFIVHAQTNVISISQEIVFWMLVGVSLPESVDL